MEDRREDRRLEINGAGPSRPAPASVSPKVPGPVPWVSTELVPEVPPIRGPTSPRGCGALNEGASTVGEPLRRPNPFEVSRHPALERGSSVLLVDDNRHHRIALLRALREQGHSVLHVADGASGETLCRASQLEFAALVACADMKHMCGFELARRVGLMCPEVRVLLMWRHFAGPEEAHRAYELGYAVIEEPFTPEELCRRLTGLLALSTQRGLRRAAARR